MPILRRDDGLQFIVNSYRETLKKERAGVIKGKVRALAHEYGSNLLVSQTPNRDIEVVFSRDSGFLLGESVWSFLNKVDNLIYCETLFERNRALLVIVKDGIVLLDANVSYFEVIEELASLSLENKKYDIYVYGDVPLGRDKRSGDYFVLEDRVVKSFSKLNESLFMRLPKYEMAKLQPLGLALNSPYFGKSGINLRVVIISIFIIIIALVWLTLKLFPAESVEPKFELARKLVQAPNSFPALSKPYPADQIAELVSMESLFVTLPPGWESRKINFDNNKYYVEVFSKGGSMVMIKNWMEKNNFEFVFKTDKIPITILSKLTPRSESKITYPLDDVLTILLDKVSLMLSDAGKVNVEGIANEGSYKEANVNIKVDKVFVGILYLIGNELNKIPSAISSINMTVEDGLYSGDIKIKVFGD